MSKKSSFLPVWAGISVVGLAFMVSSAYLQPRPKPVAVAELEEIQGLSTWRTIFNIQDCSQYNTSIANDPTQPHIPGQPPGKISPVTSCPIPGDGWCLECDGNGAQFTGAANAGSGRTSGMMNTQTMSCGTLTFGHCRPNGTGGYTCNDNGSSNLLCADSIEYWIQNPGKIPPGGQ